jgi:hypothetical protein
MIVALSGLCVIDCASSGWSVRVQKYLQTQITEMLGALYRRAVWYFIHRRHYFIEGLGKPLGSGGGFAQGCPQCARGQR